MKRYFFSVEFPFENKEDLKKSGMNERLKIACLLK